MGSGQAIFIIINKLLRPDPTLTKNSRVKKNRLSWLKVDSGKIDARVKVLSLSNFHGELINNLKRANVKRKTK